MNYIILNGNKIEISKDQTIALTRQVNSIGDMQNRQCNLSNTFKIKHNEANHRAIEFLGTIGNTSELPYSENRCVFFQNGMPMVVDGKLVINSSSQTETNVTLYWGISEFFDRLDFKLSELDFSSLNHVYSAVQIWTKQLLTNYKVFYPFLRQGLDSLVYQEAQGKISQNLKEGLCAIRVSEVISRIFDRLGFTYSGEVFNSDKFKRLSMLLPTKKSELANKEDWYIKAESTKYNAFVNNYIIYQFDYTITDLKNRLEDARFYPSPAPVYEGSVIRNNTGLQIVEKFKLRLKGSWEPEIEGNTLSVSTVIANVQPNVIPIMTNIQQEVSVSEAFTDKEFEFEVTMNPGECVIFVLKTSFDSPFYPLPGAILETTSIETGNIQTGQPFDVANNMPDITAFDFIKAFIQTFGIIIDANKRNVEFVQFEDIMSRKSGAENWPYEFMTKDAVRNYNVGSYFQKSTIKFSESKHAQASAFFEIDNLTLKAEGTVLDVSAAIPEMLTDNNIGRFGFIEAFKDEKLQDIPLTLFLLELRNYDKDLLYTNDNGSFYPIQVAPFATTDGIAPQALIDSEYESWINVLQRFERISIPMYFNEIQFNDIKLLEPYYFKKLGIYAIVESLSNFVPGKQTQVSLIKV